MNQVSMKEFEQKLQPLREEDNFQKNKLITNTNRLSACLEIHSKWRGIAFGLRSYNYQLAFEDQI